MKSFILVGWLWLAATSAAFLFFAVPPLLDAGPLGWAGLVVGALILGSFAAAVQSVREVLKSC